MLRPLLKTDVLSIDYYPPKYYATGNTDGTIMVWSLETTHPLMKVIIRYIIIIIILRSVRSSVHRFYAKTGKGMKMEKVLSTFQT